MSIPSLSASPVATSSMFGQATPTQRSATQPFPALDAAGGAGPNAAQPRHSHHHHGPAGRVQDAMPSATLAAAQGQGTGAGATLSQALAAYAPSATANGVSAASLL